MLGKINISELRFGRLIALEPTEKRSAGKTVWRCKCDCGNECLAAVKHLRDGRRIYLADVQNFESNLTKNTATTLEVSQTLSTDHGHLCAHDVLTQMFVSTPIMEVAALLCVNAGIHSKTSLLTWGRNLLPGTR
jgi:hypothetical protein